MGYTHYWTQTRDFNQLEFAEIGEAFRKIIAQASGKPTQSAGGYYAEHPVVIAGGDGSGEPLFEGEYISLNGGRAGDLCHETFLIDRTRQMPFPGGSLGWNFCKTARKPYDVVVVACLTYLAAKWGYTLGTDGEREDWDPGVRLAALALGEVFQNPIPKRGPVGLHAA